jgi:hypothetical protein
VQIGFDRYGPEVYYTLTTAAIEDDMLKTKVEQLKYEVRRAYSYRQIIVLFPTPEEMSDSATRVQNIKIWTALKADDQSKFTDPSTCGTAKEWWSALGDDAKVVWADHAKSYRASRKTH